MKAIKFFAALFMMFAVSASVDAQELSKANQKLLKKQLKEFKAEGWKVNPGQLPLETQLTKSFTSQSEVDAMGYEVWIVGEGRSTGTVYDAARTQAMTVAKGEIATKLRTDMTSTIEQDLANEQFGADEAESIAKTIVSQQGRSIDQQLNRPKTLMECWRKLPNGNTEVLIRCAISADTVSKLAKAAIQQARRDNLIKDVEKVKAKN
jgi:hypothetical protein